MWTKNIQMIQAGFQRGSRSQIVSIHWMVEKAREFQKKKNLCLLHWLPESFWLCGPQQNCTELLRWEYQTTLSASWEACMRVKKQQLEPDTEQQPGSKLGKEYNTVVHCHSFYLTSMYSTSRKMLGWMKHKLESRLPGEISTTSDMQMLSP